MAGLTDLLSTEIVPWLRDTVSIGVAAGVAYKALNLLQSTWTQQPLVSFKTEFSRGIGEGDWFGEATITVFNRSPTMLEIPYLEVDKNSEVLLHSFEGGSRYETYVYWSAVMPPYVPGASEFPTRSIRIGFKWPDDGAECELRLPMRSLHQTILPMRKKIRIILPKKVAAT
jgi:hypothetical protein